MTKMVNDQTTAVVFDFSLGAAMATRYLTTEELAKRLRTSPATVAYWRTCRTGPAGVRIGKRVLYDEQDVAEWVAEQRRQQGDPACSTG